jgi:hypothetical protein
MLNLMAFSSQREGRFARWPSDRSGTTLTFHPLTEKFFNSPDFTFGTICEANPPIQARGTHRIGRKKGPFVKCEIRAKSETI